MLRSVSWLGSCISHTFWYRFFNSRRIVFMLSIYSTTSYYSSEGISLASKTLISSLNTWSISCICFIFYALASLTPLSPIIYLTLLILSTTCKHPSYPLCVLATSPSATLHIASSSFTLWCCLCSTLNCRSCISAATPSLTSSREYTWSSTSFNSYLNYCCLNVSVSGRRELRRLHVCEMVPKVD